MSEDRIIRRTRAVSRGVLRQVPTHMGDINERMQLIANAERDIAAKLEEIETAKSEIENLMTAAKMKTHEHLGYVAEFIETKTNEKKDVSVEAARKALKSDKDFYSVLKVQLGALGDVLSEREINAIATVTPGKVTGTKFQVVVPKKKAGKGK